MICCLRNLFFLTGVSVAILAAQPGVLTLAEAESLAADYNYSVAQAKLEASEFDDAIAGAKTKRLPSFKVSTTTGMLLTKPTITFEKGTFGEYPGVGPIPGNDTYVTSARKPTALLTGEVALPLTQQHRISLGIEQLAVRKKIALEQARLTRHEVVKQVRQTYYSIVQAQTSLDAVEQTLAFLRELSQQTAQYVRVGTALDGDLLNVKARLHGAEYDKIALTGPLTTAKEQLNSLLGRAIDTEFRVSGTIELMSLPDLVEARAKAMVSRPEIEQARLKIQDAELDRRKKKSEFIPDVSLSLTYYSAMNVASTLPQNVTIAGVQASWEPFDWGRKRSELAQLGKGSQQASLGLRDVENKVMIEVGSAHRKMQEARVMLSASRAYQESTREAVRVAGVRFRTDTALLKTVLEAQSDLASANDRTQKSLAAYWSARAELEKAMGDEQ